MWNSLAFEIYAFDGDDSFRRILLFFKYVKLNWFGTSRAHPSLAILGGGGLQVIAWMHIPFKVRPCQSYVKLAVFWKFSDRRRSVWTNYWLLLEMPVSLKFCSQSYGLTKIIEFPVRASWNFLPSPAYTGHNRKITATRSSLSVNAHVFILSLLRLALSTINPMLLILFPVKEAS